MTKNFCRRRNIDARKQRIWVKKYIIKELWFVNIFFRCFHKNDSFAFIIIRSQLLEIRCSLAKDSSHFQFRKFSCNLQKPQFQYFCDPDFGYYMACMYKVRTYLLFFFITTDAACSVHRKAIFMKYENSFVWRRRIFIYKRKGASC